MCQNTNCLNLNVNRFVVDRNQNIIPTYLRTKKPQRTTIKNNLESISMGNSRKDVCTSNAQTNCEYFVSWHTTERSDPCYKRTPTLNMHRSSCIVTNLCHRSHRNDEEETNEITRTFVNSHRNGNHLEISSSHNLQMTPDQQFCARNKHKSSNGHPKVKKFGNTKASDCILVLVCLLTLAINQVIAKPFGSLDYNSNMSYEGKVQSLEDTLRSPCRGENSLQEDHTQANIRGVLQIIGRQSAIAKSIAKEDVVKYLKITEGEDSNVKDFHYRWRIMEEAWLYPQGNKLPKEFNEPIPTEVKHHFQNAGRDVHVPSITKLLQDCDERFQLLLIGFHNVLNDHNNKRSTMDLEKFNPLLEVFSRAKDNAQKVLCEIRTALQKLGAPAIILNPNDIPSTKSPNQIFYDWVVFREYINQLEHINEVVNIIFNNILD